MFTNPATPRGPPGMKAVSTYSNRLEADLAKLALEGAGIPAVVVGVGVGMEGGPSGVRLLVPEDHLDEARILLAGD